MCSEAKDREQKEPQSSKMQLYDTRCRQRCFLLRSLFAGACPLSVGPGSAGAALGEPPRSPAAGSCRKAAILQPALLTSVAELLSGLRAPLGEAERLRWEQQFPTKGAAGGRVWKVG